MSFRFRRAFAKLLPTWLGGGPQPSEGEASEGYLHAYSLGVLKDAWMTRLYQGVRARFPRTLTPGAEIHLANDRLLTRGYTETAEDFAERLVSHRDAHRKRGTAYEFLAQVRALLGYDNPGGSDVLRTVDNSGNWFMRDGVGGSSETESYQSIPGDWDWDGNTTAWSRFWVIIDSGSNRWSLYNRTVGGVNAPGTGKVGQPGMTLGTSATRAEVDAYQRLFRAWKPGGTRHVETIITAATITPGSPGLFAPGDSSNPSGQYGAYSENSGGTQVPTRTDLARYFNFL